ncbi:Uncharacterised protein [Citrobacter koseri]|nr:Uncharacterised protein [Citrobacter koseri]
MPTSSPAFTRSVTSFDTPAIRETLPFRYRCKNDNGRTQLIFQIINHRTQHFWLNARKLANQQLHAVDVNRFAGKVRTFLRGSLFFQLLQLFFKLTRTFQYRTDLFAQILAVALQQLCDIA